MSCATVYAAIPVFNRLPLTRKCVRLLVAQTYPHIQIIVADGGSTDSTPAAIAKEFPQVTLLTSRRPLWWAGAMALAIDHVLSVSRNAGDFVLMMNNDTEFDENYVSTLVRVANETGAAVGALTVDARDPAVILDAGEFIDWENYSFPVKTAIAPGEKFFDGVDVLPGRGSIVPVEMIRKAGNIDSRRFPHYIADYEFFARLKRNGFRLGVTYETAIKSDSTVTGLAARAGERTSLLQAIRLTFSRRSMNNIFDHYRLIDVAAPNGIRGHVKRHFIRVRAINVLNRLGILPIARRIRLGYLGLKWLFWPPYSVSAREAIDTGFDVIEATRSGVLVPFATNDGVRFFFPRHIEWGRHHHPYVKLRDAARRSNRRVPRAVIWRGRPILCPIRHVTGELCLNLGLNPERLVMEGVLRHDEVHGFYVVSPRTWRTGALHDTAKALEAHLRSHHGELKLARRMQMAEDSIKESQ